MRKLRWHPSALEDMQQIIDYCRISFGSEIAKEVRQCLQHDIRLLKTQPNLGYINTEFSLLELEIRSLLVAPTKILYSIHDKYIYIHLLWNTRQNSENLKRKLITRFE